MSLLITGVIHFLIGYFMVISADYIADKIVDYKLKDK